MKIVFIADIDQDVDDVVAAEYLFNTGMLDCVVLDGASRNEQREQYLKDLGITFHDDIPLGTNVVCVGGAFTKLANYLKSNTVELVVANGGFAGTNIVEKENELKKFKNKTAVRTYNFNLDVHSAKEVLDSPNVKNIILVSKNVCHSEFNVYNHIGLHKDMFLATHGLSPTKCLHDLLAAKECVNTLTNQTLICQYKNVKPVVEIGEPLNMSKWGCELSDNDKIKISVGFNK